MKELCGEYRGTVVWEKELLEGRGGPILFT